MVNGPVTATMVSAADRLPNLLRDVDEDVLGSLACTGLVFVQADVHGLR